MFIVLEYEKCLKDRSQVALISIDGLCGGHGSKFGSPDFMIDGCDFFEGRFLNDLTNLASSPSADLAIEHVSILRFASISAWVKEEGGNFCEKPASILGIELDHVSSTEFVFDL